MRLWNTLILVAVFSTFATSGMFPTRAAAVPQAPVPDGMVLVPAGQFIMGTDDTQEGGHTPGDSTPQHTRTLPAFYIDKTEVTNAQYKAYCDATGYPPPAHWNKGSYRTEEAQHPVTHINWYEAQAFARWAGKRLPSEAEWEKAARGTDGRRYPWGNNWEAARVASSGNRPLAVASKPDGASPFGALDMSGNVFEWTTDWYDAYPGSKAKNTGYGQVYKVIRGGGFDAHTGDTRTMHRAVLPPRVRNEWAGFRCAQDVENSSDAASAATPPVAP